VGVWVVFVFFLCVFVVSVVGFGVFLWRVFFFFFFFFWVLTMRSIGFSGSRLFPQQWLLRVVLGLRQCRPTLAGRKRPSPDRNSD